MIEPLESRRLLSVPAPWGAQGIQIHQDQATIDFPRLTGKGETIVVEDDGVDYTHPVLGGGIGRHHKVITGYDFVHNTPDPAPPLNITHGTSTAALAAGDGYVFQNLYYQGIAPDAQIIAIHANRSTSAAALDWIIKLRARYNIVAIEMRDLVYRSDLPEIQTLEKAGVFFGRFSGNGGTSQPTVSMPGVALTGSVDPSSNVSSFTSRGPFMDMLAPGENVVVAQTYNGYYYEHFDSPGGTSWATPQVVGAAALIKQIDSRFTPAEILAILKKTGTPIYDPASKLTYPMLNLDAALRLAKGRAKHFGPAIAATLTVARATAGIVTSPFATQSLKLSNLDQVLGAEPDVLLA